MADVHLAFACACICSGSGDGSVHLFVLRVDPRMFLWMLLLLCGDVEENPGPMLCGVCSARCTARGPKCDECGCCVHLKCSGLSRALFYGMERVNAERWVCPACQGSTDGGRDVAATCESEVLEVLPEGDCVACGVRFRRGQSGVSCSDCGTRVHKKCCSLSRQLLTRGVQWKCWSCRAQSGGVESGEGAMTESRVSVRCGACDVKLRSGQLGVSCVDCGVQVHRKCCGLNRWLLEQGNDWRCRRCVAQGNDESELPSVRDELPAGKCDKCGRVRRRGHGIVCRSCCKLLHVVCAELGSRTQAARVDRSLWTCRECVSQRARVEASERAAEVPGRLCGGGGRRGGGDGGDGGGGGGGGGGCRGGGDGGDGDGGGGGGGGGVLRDGLPSIKVAQWNCDHLQAKIPELEVWLRKNDVDVALIQETKLREEDGEVRVRGYEVVRRDRWREGRSRWSRGGGLVTLVRNGWSYRVMKSGVSVDSGVEVLHVQVMDGRDGVWSLVNVYVPPEARVHVSELELRRLPGGGDGRWLVCGDFNAHHSDWDVRVRQDARGECLMSWAEERELVLLNDGAVTRVERGSGGPPSTPDVAFCSRELASECEWRVLKELGSDHYPILISCGVRMVKKDVRRVLVWDWKRADWDGYADDVREQLLRYDWECMSVTEMDAALCDVVLSAAKRCVKRKYLRNGEEEMVSEEVREAMKRRDAAQCEEVVNDEAVMAADDEVKRLLREERERRWSGLLQKGASPSEMWSVVNGVSRRLGDAPRHGEVLVHDGKVLVTAGAKAEAFVREYEKVSRVHVPREFCLKKVLNARLRAEGPDTGDSLPISLGEVEDALSDMDGGRASGPDGVHPRLLKELPREALEVIRALFERSFRESRVPQSWRVGEVVPLLKAGKDPSQIGSFRPVCLTACLGKWMERVLVRRLSWMLESSGWLSACQAGFREGMSVNDQLVRLSQCIWDGYELREKTGLVLYDFARAYDRVWRDGLLWKLTEAGVSRTMVRWVQTWLSNRLVWVKVDGVRSRRHLFRQGLPQGAVLSPILFLVYVNDLVVKLSERVEVSAFADDLAVWKSARNVAVCRRELQWASDEVSSWCKQWLMQVSVEKCSVTLFSLDRRDAEMRELSVSMNGSELRREKLPCFLGVKYDVGLRFQEQVEKVVTKARKGVNVLRRLCGKVWGWSKSLLRATYVALVRAVLLYGSAAWAPWVSSTLWEKVERVQLEAARVVGGTLRSAPREAVLAEAGLCTVKRVAEGLWMDELEKCLRASEESLRREWGLRVVRKRLVRKGWRERAGELLNELLPDGVVRQRVMVGDAPWRTWTNACWDVDGVRSEDVSVCREEALVRMRRWDDVDVCVYTDGSADGGVRLGGAGVVVTKGDAECPEVIEERLRAAGVVTSSYQAELCALWEAMRWLGENSMLWKRAMVVSDSQAALNALRYTSCGRNDELLVNVVRAGKQLCANGKTLVFAWVPGHCGLLGNELADAAAKRAALTEQVDCACLYKSVKCLWKRRERVIEWQHQRCREVYGDGMKSDEESDWSREDVVSMARLRSGHSLELRGYRCRIGLESDDACRRCGLEPESVEHVVRCDAGWSMRAILGLSERLSDLCCRPRAALEYWRWWRRTGPRP